MKDCKPNYSWCYHWYTFPSYCHVKQINNDKTVPHNPWSTSLFFGFITRQNPSNWNPPLYKTIPFWTNHVIGVSDWKSPTIWEENYTWLMLWEWMQLNSVAFVWINVNKKCQSIPKSGWAKYTSNGQTVSKKIMDHVYFGRFFF